MSLRDENSEPFKPAPKRPRPWPAGMVRSVFGGGATLHFHTQEEYDAYSAAIDEVEMQAYHVERSKYGVWAGNQGKYVSSPALLKQLDSRHMEERYAAWLEKQP